MTGGRKMAELRMRFPQGKAKCLTLSYDDGVVNDIRLSQLFKSKGLKCTFNLNSGCWTDREYDDYTGIHRRLTHDKAKELYKGEGIEVAAHAVTHPHLENLPANVCLHEILNDRIALERDFGGIVRGFAYPYGTFNDSVIESLKACGICYARTVWSSHNFDIPKDWLVLRPTCHHEDEMLPELTQRFVEEQASYDPWLFYLWGHSYEFDFHNNWDIIENFADKVSGREDIWYATNIEVYDYVKAYNGLLFNAEMTRVRNDSAIDVFFLYDSKMVEVKAGQSMEL